MPGSTYDLIVVGSGPAGLAASIVASRLGLRVLLIDRYRHPRVKPCGGGLTQKSVAILRILGFDPAEVVEFECREVAIASFSGTYIVSHGEPLIRVSRREHFDERLFKYALSMGVDFVKDEAVGLRQFKDYAIVYGRESSYEARWVIGADGAPSRIGRLIGVTPRSHALALMSIAKGPQPNLCLIDLTRVRWGYAWAFPLSSSEGDVGLGSAQWGRYVGVLEGFIRGLGMRPGAILGHMIPYRPPRRPGSGRVMLAGDALGVADPVTGEGIAQALLTGSLAALSLKSTDPLAKYGLLVRDLINDLWMGVKVSYAVHLVDVQLASRFLGTSALGFREALGALVRALEGRITYMDILRNMHKLAIRRLTAFNAKR